MGHRQAIDVLLAGLHRLEYRGYDSAGISLMQDDQLTTIKRKGKVSELQQILPKELPSTCGMGHTRWATHGEPNDLNAHPHHDSTGQFAIVHNGIIENHSALRTFLEANGRKITSDTDTEVLVEYISFVIERDKASFVEGVRRALTKIVGAYGIAVLNEAEPDTMIAARMGSPLLLGIGDGELFVASDASPIIEYTRNVIYLKDGELAILTAGKYEVIDIMDNRPVEPLVHQVDLTLEQIEKGGHPHFMLKEILEQANTVEDAMRGRIDSATGLVKLGGIPDWEPRLIESDRMYITACGTSWHASLIGGYYLEQLAGIRTKVEYASEFRYHQSLVDAKTTLLAISQSGETADTLAAVNKAHAEGALTVGIVNAVGSSIARATDCGIFIHAGPEIGVASTKAFTSQVTVLLLFSLMLAQRTNRSPQLVSEIMGKLAAIPDKIRQVLAKSDELLELAREYIDCSNFLYLGRGFQFPIALEGALKLKEISYIHAEGYPAAEMKHGPIALIDENMPVVVMALKDRTYEKILANIQEIKARKGRVIAIANEADVELEALADHVVYVPRVHTMLAPLLTVIPLQLLAYHMAVLRKCDVDQPRNLAKSVTVE